MKKKIMKCTDARLKKKGVRKIPKGVAPSKPAKTEYDGIMQPVIQIALRALKFIINSS